MKRTVTCWAAALALTACATPAPRGAPGAFLLSDGRIVSVRPSVDNTLRFREYSSGRSGRLRPVAGLKYEAGAGFSDGEPAVLTVEFELGDDGLAHSLLWSPADAPLLEARRIGRETWVTFDSNGTDLTGRLHRPDGNGPYPGIVLVGGSGEDPGSEWLFDGDFFVAHGFAVLAYDKRGTGRSEGEFTFDFELLAEDAAAAVDFLRLQPDVDGDRIGLSGYSQGGWVAPLAASISPVSFVLVSYGMIESPADEARMEMLHLLTEGGAQGEELLLADSLVSAAVAVVASGFEDGWEEFGALKSRLSSAPWVEHLNGTPVDRLMRYPKWLVKLIGRRELPPGLRWDYDSTTLLESLCVPMTWFLGSEDLSAPNQRTIPKLRAFQESGAPFELRLFSGADHSMLVFERQGKERVYTGYAEGYFEAEVEAARKWSDAANQRPNCR